MILGFPLSDAGFKPNKWAVSRLVQGTVVISMLIYYEMAKIHICYVLALFVSH